MEYRELTSIGWTSPKAVGLDIPNGGRRPERVFFPRSILKYEGAALYAPEWFLAKKRDEFPALDFEKGLGASVEVAEAPSPAALSLPTLVEFFDAAAEGLKYPKVVLGDVKISRSGPRAKVPFALNVTDLGRYPDNKWYGRIEPDGSWLPTRSTPVEVIETVEEFAADPAGYAAKVGKLHGACAFCRKELTDERSTEVGYGPIRATKYSLPWGSSAPHSEGADDLWWVDG